MVKQVKFSDAERVDLVDLTALAAEPLAHQQSLAANFLIDPSKDFLGAGGASELGGAVRGFPVAGFKCVVQGPASDKQLRIDRGVAMLGKRDQGVVSYGALATEGDATRILDLSGYAVANWAVFIRFDLVASDPENRVQWDPATPGEFVESLDTRYSASWSVKLTRYVTSAPVVPGPEWTWIGDVDVQMGLIVITDRRQLYFEGYLPPAQTVFQPQWGFHANERNDDRNTYGIKDLRTFCQAMIQKVAELQDSTTEKWWKTTPEGVKQKIGRNGDLTPTGNYHFNDGGSNTFLIDSLLTTSKVLTASGGLNFTDNIRGSGSSPNVDLTASNAAAAPRLALQNTGVTKQTVIEHDMSTDVLRILCTGAILPLPAGTLAGASPLAMFPTVLRPEVDNTVALGDFSHRWSTLNAAIVQSNIYESPSGNIATHKGAWRPAQTGVSGDPALWDLGVTGYPWKRLFTEGITFEGAGVVKGDMVIDGAGTGQVRGNNADGVKLVVRAGSGANEAAATFNLHPNSTDAGPFARFQGVAAGGTSRSISTDGGVVAADLAKRDGGILVEVEGLGPRWIWLYNNM